MYHPYTQHEVGLPVSADWCICCHSVFFIAANQLSNTIHFSLLQFLIHQDMHVIVCGQQGRQRLSHHFRQIRPHQLLHSTPLACADNHLNQVSDIISIIYMQITLTCFKEPRNINRQKLQLDCSAVNTFQFYFVSSEYAKLFTQVQRNVEQILPRETKITNPLYPQKQDVRLLTIETTRRHPKASKVNKSRIERSGPKAKSQDPEIRTIDLRDTEEVFTCISSHYFNIYPISSLLA